jgi:hypothetical protein
MRWQESTAVEACCCGGNDIGWGGLRFPLKLSAQGGIGEHLGVSALVA